MTCNCQLPPVVSRATRRGTFKYKKKTIILNFNLNILVVTWSVRRIQKNVIEMTFNYNKLLKQQSPTLFPWSPFSIFLPLTVTSPLISKSKMKKKVN